MQQAASIGIAPNIYYISKDYTSALMEYIEADTLSLQEAKDPENIKKIARTLAQAHTMKPFPIRAKSSTEVATELYATLSLHCMLKPWLDQALELMQNCCEQLTHINAKKVTDHGDLNPRNIFLHGEQAIFIDWEYSGSEDPFMDIGYLALRLTSTPEEELLFLKAYLQRTPSEEEIKRYYLKKKLNYAQLVIFFFSFALREKESENCQLDSTATIRECSYYMNIYVNKQDRDISLAQYYFELAQACLIQARNV